MRFGSPHLQIDRDGLKHSVPQFPTMVPRPIFEYRRLHITYLFLITYLFGTLRRIENTQITKSPGLSLGEHLSHVLLPQKNRRYANHSYISHFSSVLYHRYVICDMTDSSENVTPPTSTNSRNSNSPRYEFKLNPNLRLNLYRGYRGIWVSRFGGFWGV